MTAENEPYLIAALQAHDRVAWGCAVDRHLAELYGFVYHLVGGQRTVAEELTQETWLAAVSGIEQFDASRGSFRNWLFGIARRRVALHYRRQNSAANGRSLDQHREEADRLTDASPLPEEAMEHVERRSLVQAAMLVLAEERRQVLMWKYVEGLSVEAIAGRLQRTAKAVESLLSRAREQLRGLLHGYITGGERPAGKELSHD